MASTEHVSVSAPGSDNSASNVSIRVIALAHATNENEDVYLVASLDSTVQQLKERLQQTLSRRPQPDTQRLIYQGRALTDGNVALRSILRLDPGNANSPPVHVLHLVIRGDQSTIPSGTNQPQPAQPQAHSHELPNDSNALPTNGQDPATAAFNIAQQTLPQGHPAHTLLQNVMQQHMTLHNQQAASNIPGLPPNSLPMPAPPFHFTQLPGFRPGAAQPNQMGLQGGSGFNAMPAGTESRSHNPVANITTPNGSSNIPQTGMNVRIQETIGPNGERIRRVVHNGPLLNAHMNPVERSASAPGTAPRTASRSATPTTSARSIASPIVVPPMVPQMHPSQNYHPPIASLQQPFARFNPHNVQTAPSLPARNPFVYLLSSPDGPQALLFTPSNGVFSSTQQALPMVPTSSQSTSQATESSGQTQQPAPTQQPQPTRTIPRNNDQGQVALRQQAPALGQPPAQPGRREGEDLVALILQRGWLFIRLYMFIFVLSEPGTWRRYLLLIVASLVCLLPRNNPFTDVFQAARRHFDNLIGPPQPAGRPQRPQNTDQQAGRDQGINNVESATRPNSGGREMPTHEEHARRLVHEHERRNPNFIRDTIYRIEQGVALFLASLIPGVGERHVRAREEARRVAQELEERQRREAEEQTQQEASGSKPEASITTQSTTPFEESSTSAAASTGAETSTFNQTSASLDNQDLRKRNVDTDDQKSSS